MTARHRRAWSFTRSLAEVVSPDRVFPGRHRLDTVPPITVSPVATSPHGDQGSVGQSLPVRPTRPGETS